MGFVQEIYEKRIYRVCIDHHKLPMREKLEID